MNFIQQFVNRARKGNKRLVFPEGGDERIQRVARRLLDDEIVQPILIGEADELNQQATICGISLDGIDIDSNGVLLYRKSETEIVAFSRQCPHWGEQIEPFEQI